MNLSELRIGESRTVLNTDCTCEAYRRLCDLGVYKGTNLCCKEVAIGKSPILFELENGSKIALRRCDAVRIGVEE